MEIADKWWLNDPRSAVKGFGVVLHKQGEDWIVYRTLNGSPAEAAGIRTGDRMASINDYEIGDLEEAIHLLHLADETEHTIGVIRGSNTMNLRLQSKPLAALIEEDFTTGGAAAGYCLTCKTCRNVLQGYRQCGPGRCIELCRIG